jgi:transposase
LAFAKKHKSWTVDQWRRVIFSDECKIVRVGASGSRTVWRRAGEPAKPHHVQPTFKFGGGSIMVWACITSEGPGYLCRIFNKMDASGYRSILQEHFLNTLQYYGLRRSDIILQQDNDPKHVSKLVAKWLRSNHIETLSWPSQSPDLNPIENLWAAIKKRIAKLTTQAYSIDDLWDKVQDVWNEVTKEQCLKLIDSMPKRIAAVIEAKGGHTKW